MGTGLRFQQFSMNTCINCQNKSIRGAGPEAVTKAGLRPKGVGLGAKRLITSFFW